MKVNLTKSFAFHNKERRGIVFCILVWIILWLAPKWYSILMNKNHYHHSNFLHEITMSDSIQKAGIYGHHSGIKSPADDSSLEVLRPEVFIVEESKSARMNRSISEEPMDSIIESLDTIDPNLIPDSTIAKMNIGSSLKKSWINYRKYGGHFSSRDDFMKLFGLKENEYRKLTPKLIFAAREVPVVDINNSNAEDWQMLPGIGPYYASRIINFREKLGGFESTDQIGQTYGLPDSVFIQVQAYLKPSPIFRKIMINEVTKDQLKTHPYISWKEAEWLINFRKQHGRYESIDDLRQIRTLSEEFLEKIQHYLAFEISS